jgi:hypothetical protein
MTREDWNNAMLLLVWAYLAAGFLWLIGGLGPVVAVVVATNVSLFVAVVVLAKLIWPKA